ncbi:MAG: NF038143 family protein [Desulfobacterales bacterium]|nr:NF038143 family protein [Desulfobacterales bacterium]
MPENLDRKFENILDRDRTVAKSVSMAVVKPKPLGVWDVMIPIVFILNFMKLKQTREIFIQNFMFTKELALDAARNIIKKGRTRESELAQIEDKTKSILDADTDGIYSEEIRRSQMEEIDLLIDHYCKLFKTDGVDYSSLVISTYQNRRGYTAFFPNSKIQKRRCRMLPNGFWERRPTHRRFIKNRSCHRACEEGRGRKDFRT